MYGTRDPTTRGRSTPYLSEVSSGAPKYRCRREETSFGLQFQPMHQPRRSNALMRRAGGSPRHSQSCGFQNENIWPISRFGQALTPGAWMGSTQQRSGSMCQQFLLSHRHWSTRALPPRAAVASCFNRDTGPSSRGKEGGKKDSPTEPRHSSLAWTVPFPGFSRSKWRCN